MQEDFEQEDLSYSPPTCVKTIPNRVYVDNHLIPVSVYLIKR